MKLRRNNFEIKWCEFTYSDQTTLIADPKLSLDAKRQKKNWILTFSGVFIMQKKQKKNWKSHLTRFLLLFSYVTSNEESTIYGPWGLAQVVKGWGGFVGGSRFKSQWGQKNYLYIKKKCIYIYIHTIYEFQFPSPSYIFSLTNGASR